MRPTWHFVAPRDIRWILALTGPRVHAANAPYYRKLGLDASIFTRSARVFERALRGTHLTRTELQSAIRDAGIAAEGMRLAYLVMHAELNGLICSGARRGKQFTYAWLEERVPPARPLVRDEALAELTKRYFSSHGPATVRDYVWWSGLTVKDVRAGITMVTPSLAHEILDGLTYWFMPSRPVVRQRSPSVCLLPIYDEYFVAYRDRAHISDASHQVRRDVFDDYGHQLAIDGRLLGSWRRTLTTKAAVIHARTFRSLSRDEGRALERQVERHARFLEMPVTLTHV